MLESIKSRFKKTYVVVSAKVIRKTLEGKLNNYIHKI